ncbi:hypothetical protein B0T10DRAFT_493671 [Thelonectria olida]|uniref:Zn(2)-C6 fungal-type domain-containing protein n=1 Tax=Thelonectria olida TaxID=1576542 RepID=A0A9P8VYM9_9HYPO|nr:hypothetical protein B0T10DRAFT_493671 [Thelonectria olida]
MPNEDGSSQLRSKTKLPGAGVLVLARPRATRAKAPKTRSGCKECKRRRIKCDEARPSCKRCIIGRRTCDFSLSSGAIPLPSTQNSEPHSTSVATVTKSDFQILTEPNYILNLFNSQQQWDLFSVFVFSNEQAGTLPINTLSALTPQLAQHEVAIREICCAIGAAAGAFTILNTPPAADEINYNASLKHYNRALQAIRRAESSTNTLLTVAIVSILFVTYDMLRGDMKTAFAHFSHGHRIINSYFDERCKETGLPFSKLQFSTLESAVFEMLQRLTTHPWALNLGFGSSADHKLLRCCQGGKDMHRVQDMPESFRDLAQALKWWDVVQHFLLHRVRGIGTQERVSSASSSPKSFSDPSPLSSLSPEQCQPGSVLEDSEWTESFAALHGWHNSFSPLLQAARLRKTEDPYPYLNACTLETLYLESLTSLHLHHRKECNVLPDVKPIYLEMIQTTKEMQRHCSKTALLDNAIMRPLTFVLYKCRDADICQGIKDILEVSDRNSRMAAPLLSMMHRKQGEEVPQKMKNLERAMGWYFTSCGVTQVL